jgi:AAA family ATP:ADP antiporter
MDNMTENNQAPAVTTRPWLKAGLLFINFALIIMAYYMVKAASRSMILEEASSAILPYIWIGSALLLMVLVPVYQTIVPRVPRFGLILSTLAIIAVLLLVFWLRFEQPTLMVAAAFYIFVDIFSVVLVEQFWSLTNSVYRTRQAKRWYGVIGSGGLVGGIVAGMVAAQLIARTSMQTPDLLLVSALLIAVLAAITVFLAASGLFTEEQPDQAEENKTGPAAILRENNYMVLVASILMLAQLAAPFVEYQFMTLVKEVYTEQDQRTVYIAQIFTWISSFALLINLLITPLIHRTFGAIAGLLVQPTMLIAGALAFIWMPVMQVSAALRVMDRGLSYSVNRASRELLYVPISTETLYRAKAWIDMLGYRLFKVFGSGVIILLTERFVEPFSLAQLSAVLVVICLSWSLAVLLTRDRYQQVLELAQKSE